MSSHLVHARPFLGATRIPGTDGTRHAVARLARTVGILAVVAIGIGWLMSTRTRFDETKESLPYGLHQRVLAMELARSGNDVRAVLGGTETNNRTAMRDNTELDFAFIVAYWLALVAMSALLERAGGADPIWLPAAAALAATGAAVADVKEDFGILALLDTPIGDITRTAYAAALVKWALIFVVLGIFGMLLGRRRGWLRGLGRLFLASAALGLFGLVYHPAIEWALLPAALGLGAAAVMFTARPETTAAALLQSAGSLPPAAGVPPVQPASGS